MLRRRAASRAVSIPESSVAPKRENEPIRKVVRRRRSGGGSARHPKHEAIAATPRCFALPSAPGRLMRNKSVASPKKDPAICFYRPALAKSKEKPAREARLAEIRGVGAKCVSETTNRAEIKAHSPQQQQAFIDLDHFHRPCFIS